MNIFEAINLCTLIVNTPYVKLGLCFLKLRYFSVKLGNFSFRLVIFRRQKPFLLYRCNRQTYTSRRHHWVQYHK